MISGGKNDKLFPSYLTYVMESNADIRQYTDINYLRIAVLLVAFSAVLFFSFGSAVAQVADDG